MYYFHWYQTHSLFIRYISSSSSLYSSSDSTVINSDAQSRGGDDRRRQQNPRNNRGGPNRNFQNRSSFNRQGGQQNGGPQGGGQQFRRPSGPSLKLDNPMKIQRIAAEPPPPRQQREPRGERRGGGDRRDSSGPQRPRASVSDTDSKPRTFGGGRCMFSFRVVIDSLIAPRMKLQKAPSAILDVHNFKSLTLFVLQVHLKQMPTQVLPLDVGAEEIVDNGNRQQAGRKVIIQEDRDGHLFVLVLERRAVGPWAIEGEEVLRSVIELRKRQCAPKLPLNATLSVSQSKYT